MAFFREIESPLDAEQSVEQWWPNSDKRYAAFAWWLTQGSDFVRALEKLSMLLWELYPNVQPGSNRLTRTIQTLGSKFGFRAYVNDQSERSEHVVYIDNIDDKTFLSNLENRVLWKDSFGFNHGEFSHSYQWLAAGLALGWGNDTAQLYAGTRRRTESDIIVRQGSNCVIAKPPLWQWLVDSVGEKSDARPPGYSDAHHRFCGACLSTSFRWANTVHSELAKHEDWFIGWYALHRNERLNGHRDRMKDTLLQGEHPPSLQGEMTKGERKRREEQIATILRPKLNVAGGGNVDGPLQRRGLVEHYGKRTPETPAPGVIGAKFKLVGEKEEVKGLVKTSAKFHGVERQFYKLKTEV